MLFTISNMKLNKTREILIRLLNILIKYDNKFINLFVAFLFKLFPHKLKAARLGFILHYLSINDIDEVANIIEYSLNTNRMAVLAVQLQKAVNKGATIDPAIFDRINLNSPLKTMRLYSTLMDIGQIECAFDLLNEYIIKIGAHEQSETFN